MLDSIIKRCGIYKIRNLINNDIYIGQSINLGNRKQEHFNRLKGNRHINKHLQSAFNKYGEENFVFETLLYCEPFELTYYEQKLVDKWRPIYNKCLECVDSQKGLKRTKESKIKMSLAKQGKVSSFKGMHHSEEAKEKLRIASTGHIHTEEQKIKIGLSNKDRIISEETRQRMLKAKSNISKETRLKISLARRRSFGIPMPERTRLAIAKANTGSHRSEESKLKMSIAAKKREADKRQVKEFNGIK